MKEAVPYSLFSAHGVELEYMIVQEDSLDVFPLTDRVLHEVAGAYVAEVDMGELAWSNELVLHVIELKTGTPVSSLDGLEALFSRDVNRIQDLLRPLGARLLPTAVHPWMTPQKDTRLWPHEQNAVYEAFDRIFSCKGHGWSNLQSAHLNLPFRDDEEFGRLHAAIRVLLPLMPALAASSPYLDGRYTGLMDSRLEAYRHNSDRISSVTGHVIPERVFTRAAYEEEILGRIYADLAPYDPAGILRHEWVNARGAIARFDRSTIEIRVLDVQECPVADLAVIHLIRETLKALCEERWVSIEHIKQWEERSLQSILLACMREGESAPLCDAAYATLFGLSSTARTAGDVWAHLADQLQPPADHAVQQALEHILAHGTLARRLLCAAGETPSHDRLRSVYSLLGEHLLEGKLLS